MSFYSPTQVKLWRLCKRKWAFGYVDKDRAPTTAKQQFGTDVHAELEGWLHKGASPTDTPTGKIAKQGIRAGWLPTPGPKLLVEQRFEIPMDNLVAPDVRLIGFVDCAAPPGYEGVVEPVVIDHKTTSDLKWSMSPEELSQDPQGVIYALWAMLHWGCTSARTRWVYYAASWPLHGGPPRPGGARAVEWLFDARSPLWNREFERLLDDLKAMHTAHRGWTSAAQAEPNPRACGVYGGCPYAANCQLKPEDALAAIMEQDGREHLGLRVAPHCGLNAPPETAAPAGAATGERPMNLIEKLKLMQSQQAAAPAAATTGDATRPAATTDEVPATTPDVARPAETSQRHNPLATRPAPAAAPAPAGNPLKGAPSDPAPAAPAPAAGDEKSALLAKLRKLSQGAAVNPPPAPAAEASAEVAEPQPTPEVDRHPPAMAASATAKEDTYDKMLKADLADLMKSRGTPVPASWTRGSIIAWLRAHPEGATTDDATRPAATTDDVARPAATTDEAHVVVKATDPEGAKRRQEAEAEERAKAMHPEAIDSEGKAHTVDDMGTLIIGHPPAEVPPPKGGFLPSEVLPGFPRTDQGPPHCMPFNPVTGEKVAPPENGVGFVVMFDAVYTKNQTLANGVRHLGDLVKPIADIVAADNGVEHWGLVEFHRGGPMLAAKFERWLDAKPLEGVILADSKTKEAQALRDVLVRRAGVVVQGLA